VDQEIGLNIQKPKPFARFLYFAEIIISRMDISAKKENELPVIDRPGPLPQPLIARLAANFFSYLFHPVFVPVYVIIYMVYVHPYLFIGFSEWEKTKTVIMSILMFSFYPIVTVLLLKGLNFISSFYLRTQKDRIIPFIACGIWYFWIWYVWWGLTDPAYHIAAVRFAFAIFLASSLGLMANIYMKVSMHALSLGVAMMFMILVGLQTGSNALYLCLSILVAGLVCTARFVVSDHSAREIYMGLFLGILAQLIAFAVF
jgi:hypothetical protein